MDFGLMVENLPFLLKGAVVTLRITALAGLMGILLGIVVGLGRTAGGPIIKGFLRVYVEVLRGTPLYTQLLLIVFGIPQLTGWNFDEFTAAIITIGINSSAYVGEIFRGGIQSIDKGQMEAGRSLGMSKGQTLLYIILPQAFKRVIPPLLNEMITLIKESSLVGALALVELTRSAAMVASRTYKPFPAYVSAAVIYLVMTFTLSMITERLERRLRTSD